MKGGEEFLEEEKEGVSFSSPEIPRGGETKRGKILLDRWRGREKFLLLHQRGKILLEWWRGREKFLFLHQGGKVRDRGGDFLKEEFSPTTERGGSEGEGSSLGKELPKLSGGEGSPHSEAALRRVRVAEVEALRRAKGANSSGAFDPIFLDCWRSRNCGTVGYGVFSFPGEKGNF